MTRHLAGEARRIVFGRQMEVLGAPQVQRNQLGLQTGFTHAGVLVHDRIVESAQQLSQRGTGFGERHYTASDASVDPPSELDQDVVLAGKVKIEGSPNHAGGLGNPIDLSPSESEFPKLLERGLEKALTRLGTPTRPSTSGLRRLRQRRLLYERGRLTHSTRHTPITDGRQ